MASDLFKDDPLFLSLVETGSLFVGEDLKTLCLRGPEKKLRQSRFLQPLLVAVSLGYLRRLQDRGVFADFVLGHSLGEITALAAAGVLSDRQAVTMAARRGQLMDEAAMAVDGGMLAVTGSHRDALPALLAEVSGVGSVTLANDNAPNQVVLSGARAALEAAAQRIASAKLGSCRFLSVAGPWHSPCMETARDRFAQWVAEVDFRKPVIPLVMNVSGGPEADPERIRQNVIRVIAAPVQWRQAMAHLKNEGVNSLIEIGPGRILAGLARANGFGNETRLHTVGSLKDVDTVASALAG